MSPSIHLARRLLLQAWGSHHPPTAHRALPTRPASLQALPSGWVGQVQPACGVHACNHACHATISGREQRLPPHAPPTAASPALRPAATPSSSSAHVRPYGSCQPRTKAHQAAQPNPQRSPRARRRRSAGRSCWRRRRSAWAWQGTPPTTKQRCRSCRWGGGLPATQAAGKVHTWPPSRVTDWAACGSGGISCMLHAACSEPRHARPAIGEARRNRWPSLLTALAAAARRMHSHPPPPHPHRTHLPGAGETGRHPPALHGV